MECFQMKNRPTINIYQMYVLNGNRCGFWVKRATWAADVARITSIDGRFAGPLSGEPPSFNYPKVKADVYHQLTGKPGWTTGGPGKDQEIISPGWPYYIQVEVPDWWSEHTNPPAGANASRRC
jgi:hypothetical protein